jgi:steroid delta-isomerase-like uncharacterized protein
MSEQENLRFAEEAFALLNAHDIDRYVQRLDNSYVSESELAPGPVQGRAAVRQYLETVFAAFPDLRLEVEQMLASGDFVTTRFRATGTHKGNYAGIAPTNKSASWGGCTVIEVRNGKAIRSRLYADNVSLLRQLGAISLPRPAAAG